MADAGGVGGVGGGSGVGGGAGTGDSAGASSGGVGGAGEGSSGGASTGACSASDASGGFGGTSDTDGADAGFSGALGAASASFGSDGANCGPASAGVDGAVDGQAPGTVSDAAAAFGAGVMSEAVSSFDTIDQTLGAIGPSPFSMDLSTSPFAFSPTLAQSIDDPAFAQDVPVDYVAVDDIGFFGTVTGRVAETFTDVYSTPLGPGPEYRDFVSPMTAPSGNPVQDALTAPFRAFNEALFVGAPTLLDAAGRGVTGAYYAGVDIGVETAKALGMEENSAERLARDVKAMPEAFAGMPGALAPARVGPFVEATVPARAVTRAEALAEVRAEAARRNIGILTDADPEVKAYMDAAAKREGVAPEDLHASTIGDTIMVREAVADDVRVLREEMIHVDQQQNMQIGVGVDTRVDAEIAARQTMLDNAKDWALTQDEINEITREIETIRDRGRY